MKNEIKSLNDSQSNCEHETNINMFEKIQKVKPMIYLKDIKVIKLIGNVHFKRVL